MMKIKKLLSFICAVAVSASAFAGLAVTASAEVGDVLYSQDFDSSENPWGEPAEVARNVVGTAYVDSAALENVPDAVTGNVFKFSTDEGNNGYTGAVSFDQSADAQAYEISFDTYVKNAMIGAYGYEKGVDTDPTHYTYRYSLGAGTLDTAVFGLSVTGGDISVIQSGTAVDTGIDTGDDGVWVNVSVSVNIPTHKMSGTITPANGEAYTFTNVPTSGASAGAISALFVESLRYSGSSKGYVNNYIDNLVITEAQATEAEIVDYAVVARTSSGTEIAALKSGSAAEGTVINYRNDYAIVADGKGYILSDAQTGSLTAGITETAYVTYDAADGVAAGYGFTSATDPRPAKQNGGTAVYDIADDTVGTAMSYTSNDAGNSKLRYIYYSLADYISGDYETLYMSFDSKISASGRMTLCLRGTDTPSSYSDYGYFYLGTRDGGGYRVNGTQKGGGDVWVHANYKINTRKNTLEYILTNSETGAVIDSGTATLADTPLYFGMLSNSLATAYLANLVIVQDGFGDTSDVRYTFEDDNTVFSVNGHASAAIEENADNGTNVLKFTSDGSTGESTPAYASINISKYTFGAKSVKVEYDSYVNNNNVIFGIAETVPSSYTATNAVFSHGYRSNRGYYVIYGESGSTYTALNSQWVHTTVTYDADTDTISYTLKGADGTTKSGSKSSVGINAVNYVYIFSGAASSAGYIDNIAVYTDRDYIDLSTAKLNAHADALDMDGYMAFVTDSGTGGSTPATATYDISTLTAGKGNVLISYDSYVYSGSRSTFGVDNIFSQGWGSNEYYIINGNTGSGYTFAAGTWVNTKLSIDLNAGTYKYTITNLEGDNTYSGSGKLTAKEIKAIVWKSTMPDEEAYINNISVFAYGELELTEYTVYIADYTEDGILNGIDIETTTDPASIAAPEFGKIFIWDENMKPYGAPLVPAE